jgi:hypothetical protein
MTFEITTKEEDVKQSIADSNSRFIRLRSDVEALAINDDAGQLSAGNLLKNMKDYMAKVDEKRKSYVDPLNKVIKKINGDHKPLVIFMKETIGILEKKMTVYDDRLEKKRIADEKARKEKEVAEMKKKQQDQEKLAIENNSESLVGEAIKTEKKVNALEKKEIKVQQTIKSEEVKTTFRKSMDYEIINDDLIPRQFCLPNAGKLRKAVNEIDVKEFEEGKVRPNIPGLKIFVKKTASSAGY